LPSARLTGSYTGITGLGTIGTGTWQGTSIGTTYTDAKDTTDDNVVGDVDSSEITNGAIKDEDLDLTNITLNTFTNDAGYITSQTDDQTFAEIGAGTATSVAFVIGNSATLSTTGTGTITATTANTGDSATSFFSTGTLEVAIGGTGTTTSTGSGNLVLSTSPTLTTPNIGAATGTSLIASGDINTTTGDICIDGGNCLSQMSNTSGTVTSVAAGNGMDFTTITGSGTITLGTPTTLTSTTTNSASATTHTHAITTGIANTNIVKIDHASAADNDYAKLTANGIEGRSYTEVKTDLSLNNVENTALSTWPGTTSITTLGTIGTGTWTGTSIGTTYTDAKDTTDDNVAGDVDSSEITDGTINESDLNITNTPTDNYLLSFDDTTGGFTWVAADGSGTDDQTFAEIGAGTITSAAFVVGNSATLSATGTGTINATDLICTDCIGATEISDSYLLNNGDTMDGTLTMGGSTSNIALGSNWLSNDGDDEGVWVTSTGNVGIGITTPNATLHVAGTINTTGGDICIYGGNCLSESLTSIPDSYVLTTGDTMSGPLRIRDVGGGATINIGADRTNYADTATIILQEDADNTYGTNGYGFRHRYDGSANTYYFDTASTTTTTNIYTANLGSNIIDFKATPTINGVPMIDIEVDGSITNELQTLQEVTNQGTPTTTAAITIDSDGNEQTNIGGTLYINGSSLGERVGIGTTSPSAMLEIESSGTDNANMDIDAPSGEISLINFQSAGTTKFQIQGKSASDHFVIWDNVNSESRINLRSDNGDNNYKTGMVGGTHEFLNSTEDTLMTIAGDGYVSIGTTSTSGKLTIDQNANDEALYITGGSGGQPIATFIRDLGSNGTIKITSTGGDPQIQFDPEDSGTVWSAGVDDGDGDSFKISYGGSIESGTAGISIQTDGDVGIGTTSPGAGLDVHNNVIISDGTDSCAQTENGDLCVDNDLEIDGKIMLRTANTDGILNMGGSHGEQILFKGGASVYEFVVEYDDGAAGTSLVFEQDTNPVLVLNTTGEVLVGGASDSGAYKLQVNGNICEDDGTIATCSSDERLKENILDIENATEYLIKFRPRTYNFIGESKKMSGFIAQEVNETHPELFVEKEDGYYTWDNPGLEIITVKAIQELNERINNLETENDLMKEDLCFLGIQRWC
ncbi:tail fiber domain-containing protein, partial [Candidatus Woesearchaeota archaeon]|nr:tail fiber domain-containing protein [Candidatus Woesearchaeota archaeon]